MILSRVLDAGHSPTDTSDERLKKRLLMTASLVGSVVGLAWGVLYWSLGETNAALIPGLYGAVTLLSIFVLMRFGHYELFEFFQLFSYLVLPFLLQLSLGGFLGSSAVIIWGIMAPLAALVFRDRSAANRWAIAYAAIVVVSFVLQPEIGITNSLSQSVILFFFVGNILGITTFVYIVMNDFVGQRDLIQEELSSERQRSDDLLLNILPAEVAEDLKSQGHTTPREYTSASVMFADEVGFSERAADSSASDLVGTLDAVFTRFDEIAEAHDIEKIRTIGDAYMAAAGVPTPNESHASAIVDAALEIQRFLAESGQRSFRVGISSGPLVSGVVGTSKFQFDVWGDTVNTASRMESTGEAGRVQVSESTYQMIKDTHVCVPRGTVEVKGKGALPTWFVERRNDV